MTLIAKPVIDKQFWIVKDNDRKVGNVEACAGGYQIRINNQVAQFKTIKMLAQRADIRFEPAEKHRAQTKTNLVHGYPAVGRIHNPIWDIQKKLPLYTKTNKSKSWFAAGWYRVKKGRSWTVVQDPKLIVLQRYSYQGPFYNSEEANHEHTSTKVC